jgi:rod shape-determining protein MreD
VRITLLYLILLVAQGLLGALFAPAPPPDLFLVAVLTLVMRLPTWQLVLVGYAIGLLQDFTGHGVVGLHALALAGGALVAGTVRAQLSQDGPLERSLAVLGGVIGKWLIALVLLRWLSATPLSWGVLLPQLALDSLFTILAALLILPLAATLMSRSRPLRKELL